VPKTELYRFLFPSATQQLGEMLCDHLSSFCSSSKSVVDKRLSLSKAVFDLHYVNPELNITHQLLSHFLKKCKDDKDIYAPYFVFCQSSGYGKSRLIKQLAVEASPYSWPYFCLRKKGNTGYPESCNVLADLIDVVRAGESAESALIVFRVWVGFLRSCSSYPCWHTPNSK